jgi:phage tail sheath protein FI
VGLLRENMDVLQDAHINPIVSFPGSDGVVIWGQKTLQAAASALDRINVRRLMIDLRRQVRQVVNGLLFEPNREATLTRFSGQVVPILARIQEQQGINRFKVKIDTTTTTQADVENNTIRGVVYVEPTRTAEVVSIDFVLTNAGGAVS